MDLGRIAKSLIRLRKRNVNKEVATKSRLEEPVGFLVRVQHHLHKACSRLG